MKYTKKELDAYGKALDNVKSLSVKMDERVEEIIEIIYNSFGNNLRDWCYPNSEIEGEIGSIGADAIQALVKNNATDVSIEYGSDGTYNRSMGNRYSWSFPAKWLLWTNEQIKIIIRDEIEKHKEEKLKAEASKKENDLFTSNGDTIKSCVLNCL